MSRLFSNLPVARGRRRSFIERRRATALGGPSSTGRRGLVWATAAALFIALAAGAAACGDDGPTPDESASASPTSTVTHLASLVNRQYGLALVYDPAHYQLSASTQPTPLLLGPSPLTPVDSSQGELGLSTEVPGLSVAFLTAGTTAQPSAAGSPSPSSTSVPGALQVTTPGRPSIVIDVLDLPFKAPRPANGLYRSALEQLQEQMQAAWTETFMDAHQTYYLDQGDVPAWVVEAGGLDARGRAMHVRLTVAATAGRLYLVSVVLPADEWNAQSTYVEQVLTGLKLLRDGRPSRAGVIAVEDQYRFTVGRPHDFVQVSESRSSGDHLYATDVSSIGGDLTTSYGVLVTAVPTGVENQSGLLESVYRQSAENLAKQDGVVKVMAPRREDIGGQSAWVIDYTHRFGDGVLLRTRLYDFWSGKYVYTLAVQGSAQTWGLAWRALEPVVKSFRAG